MSQLDDMYTEKYWIELIETIVTRVGIDHFVRMTIYVLYKLGHQELVKELMSDQVALLDRIANKLREPKQ